MFNIVDIDDRLEYLRIIQAVDLNYISMIDEKVRQRNDGRERSSPTRNRHNQRRKGR